MKDMSLQLEESPATIPAGKAPAAVPVVRKMSKKRKRWVLWISIAVALIAIIALMIWHHHKSSAAAMMATVETATITRGNIEMSVESAGKVMSNLDVDIKCRASGPVAKLPVDISQYVKSGDLLCQLDPTDEQLAVKVAERTVAQSTAKVEQAKLTYEQARLNLQTTRVREESALESAKVKAENLQAKADRQKQLKEQKLGSEEDFETAQTDAAAAKDAAAEAQVAIDELKQQEIQLDSKKLDIANAETQLEADKLNLNTQQQQLDYTTVTSPMDGTVSALDVQIGSMVQSGVGGFSGGTTIMTLSDLSHIFVMATVDQSDIGGIKLGQPARVEVDSFPNRDFAGKVVRIATTGVNTSNVVTFEVKVEVIDKDKNLLRPQMTGTVTIVEDQRSNVLMVPTAAVSHRSGQSFVQLPGGEKRPVKLGLEGSDNFEVISGVSEGDKVVLEKMDLPTRWKSQDGPR
jgi:multidrug efflux pump subunit AcrA (membrane-fusion protein)